MARFLQASIGRKYAMAISAMLLLSFLIVHVSLNLLSLWGPAPYNAASKFMGYNWAIQGIMQPILMAGVIFHFVMGFVLELRNNAARPVKYAMNKANENSSWMSRNMIITGGLVLAFLFLHLYDFWAHEIAVKYFPGEHIAEDNRFYDDLKLKFSDLWRVVLYVISFVLLGLHLWHGFQSSFQSLGARHPKYLPLVNTIGKWYSILIPGGFILVALFHYFTK